MAERISSTENASAAMERRSPPRCRWSEATDAADWPRTAHEGVPLRRRIDDASTSVLMGTSLYRQSSKLEGFPDVRGRV
jgi:hypothetical protein